MERKIPKNVHEDGREWEYYSYDNDNRHQWYRAMDDDEIREVTDGTYDGVNDIPFDMLWNIAEYPVYVVELTSPVASGNSWVVEGNRTNLSAPRKGMVSSLGNDYREEYSEKDDAIEGVREVISRLS